MYIEEYVKKTTPMQNEIKAIMLYLTGLLMLFQFSGMKQTSFVADNWQTWIQSIYTTHPIALSFLSGSVYPL